MTRGNRLGMLIGRSLLGLVGTVAILSGTARAQSVISAPYTCNGTTCQVPLGTYTTTVQQNMTDSASYTVTNNGTITVPLPATSVNPGNNTTVALSPRPRRETPVPPWAKPVPPLLPASPPWPA